MIDEFVKEYLLNDLVHRIAETNRHVGHADILLEQLDGRTGFGADDARSLISDQAFWDARFQQIEQVAKSASARDGPS